MIVLVAYVLPKFTTFFKEFDAELPTVTKILLDIADFFETWWWALALGALVIVLLLVRANRTEGGQRWRDQKMLRLPVIGTVVEYNVIERFCRIIAAMMHAAYRSRTRCRPPSTAATTASTRMPRRARLDARG